MSLTVCGGCRRHVSSNERACPFCGAQRTPATATPRAIGRLSRAAVFVGAAGCYTGSSPPPNDPTHQTVANHGTQTTEDSTASFALPAPTTGMATVGGTVVDEATSQPLARVNVQLLAAATGDSKYVETDNAGRYVFANVAPGNYQLMFKPRGSNPGMAPYPHAIDLVAGKATTFNSSVSLYDPSNTPMPYGAPPARRRVV